jgi:predicted DNA-binding transcriptional regulator AlpA
MGIAEVCDRFGGISRQRVDQLSRRADWPAPYDRLSQGRVWTRAAVEAWIQTHRPDLVTVD